MATYYTINNDKQYVKSVTLGNFTTPSVELDADTADESAYFEYDDCCTSGGGGGPITGDLHDIVATKAARAAVGSNIDGYKVNTISNGLTYEIVDGSYRIRDYRIDVDTAGDFAAITEPETNQIVYIIGLDKKYLWDGIAWHEIENSSGGGGGGGTGTFTPQSGWSDPANDMTDKVLDANASTHQELADYVSTIVVDLKNAGIFTT